MGLDTRLSKRLGYLLVAVGCAAPQTPNSSPSNTENASPTDTENASPTDTENASPTDTENASPTDTEQHSADVTFSSMQPSGPSVGAVTPAERAHDPSHPQHTPHDSSQRDSTLPTQVRPAQQLYQAPITHIATGKHRVAAIARTLEGSRVVVVHELPTGASTPKLRTSTTLPAALQSESVELHLFLGRDDWPRIILSQNPSGQGLHYYRYRPTTGWDSPTDEQGALAKLGRVRGFYGVLGHADPEVLCVPNHECYEKRVSGWQKRSVPGPDVWRVALVTAPTSKELEAWAWPSFGALAELSRLRANTRQEKPGSAPTQGQAHWHAELPAPNGNLRQLLTWNSTYVALTDEGLFELSRGSATTEASSAPPASWSLLTTVRDGLDAAVGPSSELLVATSQGLFAWRRAKPAFASVELELPEQKAARKLGLTRRIAATVGPQTRHLVAGDDGLFLLENDEPDGTRER
jgi:hypothetical protein